MNTGLTWPWRNWETTWSTSTKRIWSLLIIKKLRAKSRTKWRSKSLNRYFLSSRWCPKWFPVLDRKKLTHKTRMLLPVQDRPKRRQVTKVLCELQSNRLLSTSVALIIYSRWYRWVGGPNRRKNSTKKYQKTLKKRKKWSRNSTLSSPSSSRTPAPWWQYWACQPTSCQQARVWSRQKLTRMNC